MLQTAPAPSREPELEPEILGSAPVPEPKVGARLPSGQKRKNFERGFGAGGLFKFFTDPRAGAGAAYVASAPALGAKSRSRSRNFDRGNL
uniref:Uncharacterized protein n=1 Tax=Bursaphelenchus xylophilus TaxID=6326 RepID=A0A1I7SKW9_BURXY